MLPKRVPAARARHLAVAAATLASLAVGCGDSGNKSSNPCKSGEFCVEDNPRLVLDPPDLVRTVVESGQPPGTEVVVAVTVENSGTGTLRLDDVSIEYTPPAGAVDDQGPAFELMPFPTALPLQIFPLGGDEFPQGAEVRVRYLKQSDGLPRQATLVFSSNDRFEPTTTITISTESGAPRLAVDPEQVEFGLVSKDSTAEKRLTLLNTGAKTLNVSGFRIAQNGHFGVKEYAIGGNPDNPLAVDLAEAIQIGPGSAMPITVTFVSDSPAPAQGELLIYSDDPKTGSTGLSVDLVANQNGPCILVEPRRVDFGAKLVGTIATIEMKVTSCGTEPLEIRQITLTPDSSGDFDLPLDGPGGLPGGAPTPLKPILVPINGSINVPVTFVPDEVNARDADLVPIPDEGVVLIDSNAFEAQAEVELSGVGADLICPTAVIDIAEGEEVIPQTVLHLDGTQSFASAGPIASYFWSVTQPDGSQEKLLPTPTDPEPQFQVNVVGLYEFRLSVFDANGLKSCEDAVYQVIVQPDQAIHVELTWVTPGDEDETDVGEARGSDMDLHFTHPNATGPDLDGNGEPDPWFDELWDCFWYNPEPNWGTFDPNADDDPSLDRDDTDGAGPENLNLGVPEESGVPGDPTRYRVGVHYWDAHGFGDATATVRIFTYATEIYAGEMELTEKDMWCVGEVLWPDAVVEDCPFSTPPHVVADYVNPLFFAP
ncbi:MAG: hypothetical protein H6744_09115 [Deltaproteobacteria bacterium]|nr:hypothetical protein [Deltaproteobacteria bacterium]MCB9786840.1 hypothetical protein [Deltaproteobacteria bacterium]